MLDHASQFLADCWPVLIFITVAACLLYNKYGHGLNKYPGPALAAYTDWWRFWHAWDLRQSFKHIELMHKYGDVVRFGPRRLMYSDPRVLREIYAPARPFPKSEMYSVQQVIAGGEPVVSLFSARNEQWHSQLRRAVSSAFAMTNMITLEPLIDSSIRIFLDKTDEHYCRLGRTCDFGRWLQFFAFDTISKLAWREHPGFVDSNGDVNGIIAQMNPFFKYCARVGQLPWLDKFLHKNPIKLLLSRYGLLQPTSAAAVFARAQSTRRAAELEKIKQGLLDPDDMTAEAAARDQRRGVDVLTRLTQAQRDDPVFFTDVKKLSVATSIVIAGSDTTASTLGSVFYHVLRSPSIYAKLQAEVDSVAPDTAGGLYSYAAAQAHMPYLDGVIMEALRLTPAAAMVLERVVPVGGARIAGEHVPGGTVVGVDGWALHRNRRVFGPDADMFRPERWVDAAARHRQDPADDSLRRMKAGMIHFGAGTRTCIGRNIASLELYKLVPALLRRYRLSFYDERQQWHIVMQLVVKIKDFNVLFTPRSDPEKASPSPFPSLSAAETAA